MKSFLKKNVILLVVLLLVTVAFLHFGRAKAGFFIDEIHTYGLSNSHYAPYISDAVGGSLRDVIITRQQLLDYATVDSGQVFDFASVYSNQVNDVHPPLFYFLFNMVSSLVGQHFSKWTGLCLNYVVFMASLIILYKLSLELYEGNRGASVCAVALYGLSTIGISTLVYIRMYMLLSFFTILLAYYAIKLMREEKRKYCYLYGLTVFLGMFTQYYFVFYAFFLSAALCIHFIRCRNKDILWRLALSAFAGVILLVVAFPASLSHIFVGNGKVVGGTSVGEAITNTGLYGERLYSFMHFVSYGLKAAILCACLAIIVYRKLEYRNTILIIVLPAVLAWFVVAIISPVYEERYIYNLAPIFVLLAAWFVKDDMKFVPVAVAVSIACLFISKPNNLFSSHAEYNELLRPYSSSPCVYLQDDHFEGLTYDFSQLLIFDEIYATDSPKKAGEYIDGSDNAVVFVDQDAFWSSGYDADVLLPQILESSDYDTYSQLYSNGFSGVYLISKGAD